MLKNELGYPTIDSDLRQRLFGDLPLRPPTSEDLEKVSADYAKLGIPLPVSFSEGLYTEDVPIPELQGDNIIEHFESIAEEAVGDYVRRADSFASCELPQIPDRNHILFNPGWTRYEPDPSGSGFITSRVDFPLEKAYTYDTETYVSGGAFPIIATCVSAKASYIWLASELINPDIPEGDWDSYNLVPIGAGNFVAGHNISYDRVRCQEAYSLESEDPENFYFDTLSAHVAVSGLASGQRWIHVLNGKDPEMMTEEEKKKLRIGVNWLDKGAMNSLVAAYNYHVHLEREWSGTPTQKLGSSDKKARNIFVDATSISEITAVLEESVEYAVKDAYYTAELFQSLWWKYKEASPSMVAMAGHYYLAASRIPLTPNWEDWKDSCESAWSSNNDRMAEICQGLAKNLYESWRPLYNADLESVKELYEGPDKKFPTFLKSLDADGYEWRVKSQSWVESDPWNCQLDWDPQSYTGSLEHYPRWYRPFLKKDFTISSKNRTAHLLLKLRWKGEPVIWTTDQGWAY